MAALPHTGRRPWPRDPARESGRADAAEDVARVRSLARWLDARYLDPILGFLLPGVGDLVTSGVGLYTIAVALRLRLPPVVIARMLLNLAIDAALGAVPLAGDLFDVAFRAHTRNLRLLEARGTTRRATKGDWALVLGALLLFLAALAFPIVLLVLAVQAIV